MTTCSWYLQYDIQWYMQTWELYWHLGTRCQVGFSASNRKTVKITVFTQFLRFFKKIWPIFGNLSPSLPYFCQYQVEIPAQRRRGHSLTACNAVRGQTCEGAKLFGLEYLSFGIFREKIDKKTVFGVCFSCFNFFPQFLSLSLSSSLVHFLKNDQLPA